MNDKELIARAKHWDGSIPEWVRIAVGTLVTELADALESTIKAAAHSTSQFQTDEGRASVLALADYLEAHHPTAEPDIAKAALATIKALEAATPPAPVSGETERAEMSRIALDHFMPPLFAGGSWTLNPNALADALIAAGYHREPVAPTTVEWGIKWAEIIPGFLDIAIGYESEALANAAAGRSAFPGTVVSRNVSASPWAPVRS